MLVICDQCGIEFNKNQCKIKRTKHNFCSRKCSGAWLSENTNHAIIILCQQCGAECRKKPSVFKRYPHAFCSKACYCLSQRVEYPEQTCQHCKKSFQRKPSSRKYKTTFCSVECYSLARRLGEMRRCCICGKEVYRDKAALKKEPIQFYCSQKCYGELIGTANHLKKLGNFSARKDVHVLLAKVRSMLYQEVQTAIKETPR